MNKPEFISIIVTSYNWSNAMAAVLYALDHQTDRRFEVLIADDGSRDAELARIEEVMEHIHCPVRLMSQEDQGFRAAKIRNQAAAKAKGDYLIFIDGDCVTDSHFIARHRALAEPGYWVSGNRILLEERFTQKVLSHDIDLMNRFIVYWWFQRLRGNINRCAPLIHWPFSFGRKQNKSLWKGAKTCNLGVWKKDFFAVNGFDERYEGWGYEDSDLVIRLIRSGVYRKSGKFALPIFHLWHPEQDRGMEPENLARLKTIVANQETRAALGVDQYA